MLKSLALLVLIFCTTLVVTHSRVIQPNGANIIQQTCSKTPNPALCIAYLNADPRSSTSDVNGLALIMLNVIKSKISIVAVKINQLRGSIPPGDQKNALMLCATRYVAISDAVTLATHALQNGNPKLAADGATDAIMEANSCEHSFSGKSLLTAENNAMLDVSAIAAAICRLLF